METAAFLGLLGLGWAASKKFVKQDPAAITEGFATAAAAAAEKTVSKKQRLGVSGGGYDIQFDLPSGGRLPAEPNPSSLQATPFHLPVPPASLPTQTNPMDAVSRVQLRPDRQEMATDRPMFVSQLTGLEFQPGEFKHNNMVPFAKKFTQNTSDTSHSPMFDSYTGNGQYQFAKREQGPMFEPTKEPAGNPFGFESHTDFVESRMVESRNRAGERPVEQIHVGPGLDQGFTHLPSGGFNYNAAGDELMKARMPTVDDMRVATNPKLSYKTPVVQGSHYVASTGDAEMIGEVRKYNPDTFYVNTNGERNFVTVGADTKPAVRSVQVLKHTARPETTREYTGVGGQTEGKATYTVGSTRTPLAQQMGSWGFRNADATMSTNPDTDAAENDYGKAGVDIRPNERYYTGTRVHATNIAADKRAGTTGLQDTARTTRAEELIDNPRAAGNFNALAGGMAEKQTMYDPNDIARTTIKETTIDNDWIGMAAPVGSQPKLTVYDPNDVARTTIKETTEDNEYTAPASGPQKLTVYDPDDIARVTGRNTLSEWDMYRNFGRQDGPDAATTRIQDKIKHTQKATISAKSAYTGAAEAGFAKSQTNRESTDAMRHYARRENIAKGRTPTNSSSKVFNGKDYVNMRSHRLVNDSVNDRQMVVERVAAEPTTVDVIGVQRPRAILKLDVAAERNASDVISALASNPYALHLAGPQ